MRGRRAHSRINKAYRVYESEILPEVHGSNQDPVGGTVGLEP